MLCPGDEKPIFAEMLDEIKWLRQQVTDLSKSNLLLRDAILVAIEYVPIGTEAGDKVDDLVKQALPSYHLPKPKADGDNNE